MEKIRKVLKRCAFPYCPPKSKEQHPAPTEMSILAQEQVVENGRIIKRMVEKTIDRAEESANTNYLDYCLENQIAVGSKGLQQRVFAPSGDVDATLNHLDELGKQMDDAAAAAQAAQQQQNQE